MKKTARSSTFYKVLAVVGFAAAIGAILIVRSFAFNGPSLSGGNGNGAIGVGSGGSVSVGTSTPLGNTMVTVVGSSSDATAYGLQIQNSAASSLFSVRNDGAVTVPGSLTVNGILNGSVSAATVFSGEFGSSGPGTPAYSFPGDVGIGTTSASNALTVANGNIEIADSGAGIIFPDGTTQTTAAAGSGGYNSQMFTSGGTWTRPAGVNLVWVTICGGGGGGGGFNNLVHHGGGGGGAGACFTKNPFVVSGNVTVVVGAGGSGAADGNDGGSGGTSTFGTLTADGGGGGGVGSGSDDNGGSGGGDGAGDGGAWGNAGGNGNIPGSEGGENGSSGGGGGAGIGNGGNGGSVGAAGTNGSGYGTGGGGDSGVGAGNGAPGVVVVEW